MHIQYFLLARLILFTLLVCNTSASGIVSSGPAHCSVPVPNAGNRYRQGIGRISTSFKDPMTKTTENLIFLITLLFTDICPTPTMVGVVKFLVIDLQPPYIFLNKMILEILTRDSSPNNIGRGLPKKRKKI